MGRHSENGNNPPLEPDPDPADSKTSTLAKITALFSLPAFRRDETEPDPDYGVGENAVTEQWLKQITEDRLPNLERRGYENWEYRIFRGPREICGGWYGLTPNLEPAEAADEIRTDWLGWNAVGESAQPLFGCAVRRVGSLEWTETE